MAAGGEPLSLRIVNAVFSTQQGGLEQASLDYAGALSSLGHGVTLLLGTRSPFLKEAQALGCPVHLQSNRFGKFDPFARRRLRRWLRQERPDIILAHGNRAMTLLRDAAQGLAPVIGVNHSRGIKTALRMEAVITVNDRQKARLLAAGFNDSARVFVVPNMVKLTDEQRRLPVSHAPQTPPVIGVLARLVPVKGVDVLLEALAVLKARGVAFRARIGGEGAERAALQQLADRLGIADQVEFCGWVSDCGAFYRSLDVYCLPSRAETFGIAMLEAMQHKLPVAATRCDGVEQLVAGHHVALLSPPGDSMALADSLSALLADWPLAQRLAAAGYGLVAEKYDIQIVAGQLQNIITQLLQAHATNQQGVLA